MFKVPITRSPGSLHAYWLLKTSDPANLLMDHLKISDYHWNLISNCLNRIHAIMYFQWFKWTNTQAFQVVGTEKKPLLILEVSKTDTNTLLDSSVCVLPCLAERPRGKVAAAWSWAGRGRSSTCTVCKALFMFQSTCRVTCHSNTSFHVASHLQLPKCTQPYLLPTGGMCFHHSGHVPWRPFPKEIHSQ